MLFCLHEEILVSKTHKLLHTQWVVFTNHTQEEQRFIRNCHLKPWRQRKQSDTLPQAQGQTDSVKMDPNQLSIGWNMSKTEFGMFDMPVS